MSCLSPFCLYFVYDFYTNNNKGVHVHVHSTWSILRGKKVILSSESIPGPFFHSQESGIHKCYLRDSRVPGNDVRYDVRGTD